jgi:NAD(P)-dependent dehydrogenase (short-subunit alcohol dehydrogenase family)
VTKELGLAEGANELEGRNALITGAGSGIGREAALLMAGAGARVIVCDVDEAGGIETVSRVGAAGGEADFVRADVSKASDMKNAVEFAKSHGGLHVMFNNAGIFPEDDGSPPDTTEEVWDLVMNVNLKGVFLGCKYGIPAMIEAGGGSATSQIAYTASKGGVLAMTREIAVEYARQGIRANALCPGPVNTPLLEEFLRDPEKKARRLIHIPMGRLAEASEIARAALYLASPSSSYVTGTTFMVDGGITAAYVTPE